MFYYNIKLFVLFKIEKIFFALRCKYFTFFLLILFAWKQETGELGCLAHRLKRNYRTKKYPTFGIGGKSKLFTTM